MAIAESLRARALLIGFCLSIGVAHAMTCDSLPTSFAGNEFPTGNFFSNFDNPCYTIRPGTGVGAIKYGDLNAVYYQLYYKVDPRFELILVGDFPNARYFSVTLYDAHSALSQSILDTDIVPLTSDYRNPFAPHVSYAPGQQYAIPISFGGTPGIQQTGCQTNGYNMSVNGLDGTRRHPGMDWNSDAGLFQQRPGYVVHALDTPQHTNPNTAGVVMARVYLNDGSFGYDNNPRIIVRDVASGCAYPAEYVLNTLQIVTGLASAGSPWLDQTQFKGHHVYETNYLPKLCNAGPATPDVLQWMRQPEYVPATNPDAAYIVAPLAPGLPAKLAATRKVMRIRMRIPSTPPTPCTDGCSRSGREEMRYMSLSFLQPGGFTLASLADSAFTKDADGFATLIVGTGASIPSWITPANGYTFLDLTTISGYQELSLLDLRHMIPAVAFKCSGQSVPYRTALDTPAGSLLGDYTPVVDYPAAATLPDKAARLVRPDACGNFPAGDAGIRPSCGVFSSPVPSISTVVTQCLALGCTQFIAQADPPITIVGSGFGTFPKGLPFSGTSEVLHVHDVTRSWDAGFHGDACSVSVTSWYTDQIQFIANVGGSSACQLFPGDKIRVEIWNPQTHATASFETTAH